MIATAEPLIRLEGLKKGDSQQARVVPIRHGRGAGS